MESYYDILDVPETASCDEIRRAFMNKARVSHPDKVPNRETEFVEISTAYEILSDPIRRIEYDLQVRREISTDSFEQREMKLQIRRLRKEQAMKELEMMKKTYEQIRNTEFLRGGLVILKAIYGTLPKKGYRLNESCIDATVQLQCQIENSKLYMPENEPKSLLPGIYNPIPDTLCSIPHLRILYQHGEILHEVEVTDREKLWLPLRGHGLTSSKKKVRLRENSVGKTKIYFSDYALLAVIAGSLTYCLISFGRN